MLGRGDFFGEGCLAGQPVRMATASAMTDVSVVRIERQAMIGLLHERSLFSERFMAHLLARNVRIEEDLVDQLFNSSEKRLARVLLLLARFGKEGATEPMIPKISQEVLAEMVGTTRPRINEFMNKFRKLGFIQYNGGLHIHSSLLNVLLHDKPPAAVGRGEGARRPGRRGAAAWSQARHGRQGGHSGPARARFATHPAAGLRIMRPRKRP